MFIENHFHLSYCSNIHPGESWADTFANLKRFVPGIKQEICPDANFGIGLRLSNQAVNLLVDEHVLQEFSAWLQEENLYVFTLNGFPYGGFHHQVVKDKVYQPDWGDPARLDYSRKLFRVLSRLLPPGVDGGVSTVPISYKPWFKGSDQQLQELLRMATNQLADMVKDLHEIKLQTGKLLHLDIEPEPNCVLETTEEFIQYFKEYLLVDGVKRIARSLNCSHISAEEIIRAHCQLCFDVCHAAVEFENPAESLARLAEEGIEVGKVQISSALRASNVMNSPKLIADAFRPFNEPTYLHQVMMMTKYGQLEKLEDLPELFDHDIKDIDEIRAHFHVPIFLQQFQNLYSTQPTILETFEVLKNRPFTRHLEVETYTWEVLPEALRIDLASSITRELNWVLNQL